MATVVGAGGDYIAKAGGFVRRWEPPAYVLQAGETGFLGFPTLAELQGLGLQGRVARTIPSIYTDLKALTAAQQNNVWTDISTGNKYLNDDSGIIALDWGVRFSGLAAAAILDAKFRIVAIYVRDHPRYLVNPAFDATINVPGDQLA